MMDRTIPWIGLAMQLNSLKKLPDFALPGEYGVSWFQPGDERHWTRIETSAGEFPNEEAGLAGFRRYYPSEEHLAERMLFLTDHGVPFATATAWYDEQDLSVGRLHWVSVDAVHQGRRLSYPLVSLTLRRMRELGHRSAFLTTQTASWPAIKVYHGFHFVPMIRSTDELEGWRLVSEKTGINFLQEQ